MTLGFIGLGHMGIGMVRALLRAGHRVIVFNRTRAKAEAVADVGAEIADRPADACRGDAVFTMLSDDGAVEQIVGGPHGVIEAIGTRQTIHVSASTISPALVRALAERHRVRGQRFVSAPVLGRPEVAEQGKLTVIAAGDAHVIAELRPAFDAIARNTFVVGREPEAANVVKLACNTMVATIIEMLGETLALVGKSGVVERAGFLDVLLGTLLSASVFRPYVEHARDQQFEPGFRLPLALKDMELALDAAREHAVAMPVVSVIRDHMLEAIAAGFGELDWGALALVPQRAAGIEV